MGTLLGLILSALLGLTSLTGTPPKAPQPIPLPGNTQTICLDESVLRSGIDPGQTKVPKRLYGIKKPNQTNISQGYLIPECQNKGSCEGPDTADYVLVATNVKVDHTVFPNSFVDTEKLSDRQLVRQTDTTGNPILADKYRNRIYRTHCGDWCFTCKPADVKCLDASCLKVECDTRNPPVELPYKGSFHCDFIYYLQDNDGADHIQIDENGNIPASMQNPNDPNVLVDETVYSVYFRQNATFPKDVQCETKNEMPIVTPYSIGPSSNEKIQYPPGSLQYWRLVRNPNQSDGSYKARNSEVTNYVLKGMIDNPFGFPGKFQIYSYLLDPPSVDFLYLVPDGTVEGTMNNLRQNPPVFNVFSYYLLENWNLHEGSQKSLKLGSVPLKADWVKKWVTESKPAIYLYPKEETEVTVKLNPLGYLTVSDPPYDPVEGWKVRVKPEGQIIPSFWGGVPTDRVGTTTPESHTEDSGQARMTISNTSQVAGKREARAMTPGMVKGPKADYSYLYYEAQLSEIPNPKTGFVVKNEEVEEFLNEKVQYLGLNEKETNDYLEYWLPRLTDKYTSQVARRDSWDGVRDREYYLIYFLSPSEIERIEPINISLPIETAIRIRTYFKPLDSPIDIPEQKLDQFLKERTGNVLVEWGGILDD